MKKLIIPIILFTGISINVFAEEKSTKELEGDKYYFVYSFDKAIDSYSRTKQLSTEGQRRLAKSYSNMNQNLKADSVYSKLVSAPEGVIPEDHYNYSMVLRVNGKHDQAGISMDKFKGLKPGDLRVKDYTVNKAKLADLLKDNGKYKINNLNINTDADDFGVCYYKDKVVFASSGANPRASEKKYNWSGKPFLDLYVSEIEQGQLKNPEIFDKSQKGKMHHGPASFSKDANFMAFSQNDYDTEKKNLVVRIHIFFSNYIDGKWSSPEPFVLNNTEYSVGQPCLTADGNTMYFTSDMSGGFGGMDIYKIKKDEKGTWGKAENLGDKINTEGDELFPFFEENNQAMFFASNGRFGLGGLDIFISEVKGSEFTSVHNAGSPLNTRYDDFAVVVDSKMSKGYFSSNRNGRGDDDIYAFDLLKAVDTSKIRFSVVAPKNIPVERRVRETFPLRNYVFFDLKSTEIPDRYVLLKKDQVKDFKEDQLEVFTPKRLSGRSARQMTVYYNVLNILGDRMGKNPSATITLVGSSENGIENAREMAESVKKYLVSVFGITASRITTEGRLKPKIPSEQPGGTLELELLREGDQRVSIESNSPLLLIQFKSGPDAPLKPVEIVTVQESPLDSYVSFNVEGGKEEFSSWSLEIADEKGAIQKYGPYTKEEVAIPGKSILGTRPEGDFKVTMIGKTKIGGQTKRDTSVHMVLWTPSKDEEGMRFSIIYEFNESKAIAIYERYLTDIVIPKIPKGGTVIIHGHSDIIGDEASNQNLSLARANDARSIFENGLLKAQRNDVKFKVFGFGEDQDLSPFENKFPEERFYNRTVVIDIIPTK